MQFGFHHEVSIEWVRDERDGLPSQVNVRGSGARPGFEPYHGGSRWSCIRSSFMQVVVAGVCFTNDTLFVCCRQLDIFGALPTIGRPSRCRTEMPILFGVRCIVMLSLTFLAIPFQGIRSSYSVFAQTSSAVSRAPNLPAKWQRLKRC